MGADSAGIDALVEGAVFAAREEDRQDARRRITESARARGIEPASIQGLYEAAGKGLYRGITVPAINIRGLTYQVARAVFRAALRREVGAFIFEIARSEIGYTKQRPGEYAACVLAAAVKEEFSGRVFIQGDHFQVNAARYASERDKELKAIEDLIRESVAAGFLNIDVDASTLVNLGRERLDEQQEDNSLVTARMTRFIRGIEPKGMAISVGGEIGEVGGRNSTVEDLRAFMKGYLKLLDSGVKGISKISVQTGTTHGGVVLPDGSIAKVELDLKVLEQLSNLARQEYGMAGAVQHGASTLPDDAFSLFPQGGTAEVHLATGFQNIIYDSPHFPGELLSTVNNHLLETYAAEKKAGETREQFLYKTRKKAFGDFKKELWDLPEDSLEGVGEALEKQFSFLFQQLNVVNTVDLVKRYVAA
ncbi:MAG: class II D-tagatose-bisphosphate aldolase, non-catalytic subunit [Chloroflexi bacterium]|nr:class II D-tagatose-bisphosphate aldolase, non-catalytic subunit [Chloroflexota bacterium]